MNVSHILSHPNKLDYALNFKFICRVEVPIRTNVKPLRDDITSLNYIFDYNFINKIIIIIYNFILKII